MILAPCSVSASQRLLPDAIAVTGKHGKRHVMRAHKQQAVSDWLNPHSLGTMSNVGYVDNLAYNSTCLINYAGLARSI